MLQSSGDGHRSAALNLNSGYLEYFDAIFMRWRLAKSAQEPHKEEISRRKFGPPTANMAPTMAALIMSNFSLILATRFLICKRAKRLALKLC